MITAYGQTLSEVWLVRTTGTLDLVAFVSESDARQYAADHDREHGDFRPFAVVIRVPLYEARAVPERIV